MALALYAHVNKSIKTGFAVQQQENNKASFLATKITTEKILEDRYCIRYTL